MDTSDLFIYLNHRERENHEAIKYFTSKDEARVYSAQRGNVPMFSVDMNDKGGSKFFVVTGYLTFCEHYLKLQRPLAYLTNVHNGVIKIERFAYEVVLEGVPLDIYLDLEGSRLTNSDVDFDAVYASLMQEFEMFLKQMRITGADLPPTIVVLDSSNAKKFSKHVIYRLKESVFANNYICGALMRNFHLHLLRRYGPPETNKFYINPEEAAVKKNVKKCLLDFAVYTKNRDFRLVGSCKRKDCSTANPIRWLWMEGQPNVLNQDIVLNSLIQRCNRPIRYHIAKVIDTLNGGIPFSSSLSTAHKTNHLRDQRDQRDRVKVATQPVSTSRLGVIGENIAKWILTAFPNYFRDVGEPRFNVKVLEVNVGEVTVKINFPNVYYCQSRLKKTGQPNHKTNSICFMVNSASGSIYQMCASNTCKPPV